jgi:hypothetical protein
MPLLAARVLHATGIAVKTLIDRGLGSLLAGAGQLSEGRNLTRGFAAPTQI